MSQGQQRFGKARFCHIPINIHSIYVDQWDWEKIITKEERTLGDTLKDVVRIVYKA